MKLIAYMGSKQSLLKYLLPLPKHKQYVEVFGGSAALLLNKQKSKYEVYNDVNDLLVNMFVQLKENPEELKKRLTYTIHSRSLFKEYAAKLKGNTLTSMEKAVYYIYCNYYSFGSKGGKDQYSHRGLSYNRSTTYSLHENLTHYKELHKHIKNVDFFNLDYKTLFTKLLRSFDKPDVLIYVDPPYSAKTKYNYGFTNEEDLVNVINYCNQFKHAKIIFSYDKPVLDWKFKKLELTTSLNNKKEGFKRDEYIFYKRAELHTPISNHREL